MSPESDPCPHCGVDLRQGSGYSRKIGVEIPEVYDGALLWCCPDCKGYWHRFQSGHYREKAERYLRTNPFTPPGEIP